MKCHAKIGSCIGGAHVMLSLSKSSSDLQSFCFVQWLSVSDF